MFKPNRDITINVAMVTKSHIHKAQDAPIIARVINVLIKVVSDGRKTSLPSGESERGILTTRPLGITNRDEYMADLYVR